MFKISVSQAYFTPVKVEAPADGGKTDKFTFDAQFKRLPQSDLDALNERLNKREMTDQQLIDQVMIGWKGVQDQDGNDLEFSPSNLKVLLEIFPTRACIVQAFFDSLPVVKQKN